MGPRPVTESPGGRPSPPARFAALDVPNYRRFIAGQGVSLVGSWTETVAQGVLVLGMTGSPVDLGIVAAARYLPVLLLAPYAGVLVDRHDRRRTLLVTQSSLACLALAFGVVVLTGHQSLPLAMAVAVAFGVLTAVDNPARMALIPELVGREALHSAVTLNSILANVGRGVGPVVAAALIGSVGIGWCFVANAGSFVLVIALLLSMRTADIRSDGRIPRQRGQLRAALRVVRGNAQLLGPLAMMAVVGTLAYEYEVSLPVFGEHSLAGGPDEYAWLTAGFGVGSIAAGVVLLFRPWTGLSRMIVVTVGYALALAVTAAAPGTRFANVTIVLVGACSIGFLTTGNATVQLYAPPGMRGRVTSLWTTAFLGTTPVGALVVGWVGQELGGRAAVALAAAACAVAVGVGVLVRARLSSPAVPAPAGVGAAP
ncbi:MFS transporter [Cellulosimicrobium sp. BIT-GX5]|uniref:MFS transporter n=1 Tax=Cellulosimicrobium composti TaxID=2672572 RepID=A0A6N7ZK56_9MICO|nr:MFS transporter [Cellulosimicrobium composti]MTG89730.1 MFS transporter [Cellulosimicrobium composti]